MCNYTKEKGSWQRKHGGMLSGPCSSAACGPRLCKGVEPVVAEQSSQVAHYFSARLPYSSAASSPPSAGCCCLRGSSQLSTSAASYSLATGGGGRGTNAAFFAPQPT